MASIHTVNPLEFCQTIMAGKTRECAFVVQYYSTAPSSVSWSLQRLIVDGILVRDLGGKWVHSGFFSGRQSNNWPFSQKHICITCCLLLYLVVPWQNWCDLGVDMFFFLRVGMLAVGASDPCIESTAGFYMNMMVLIFKITFTLDYCYLTLTAVWASRQKLLIPLHC